MMDSKVINVLKKMREEEKELICADFDTETTLGYTHGDKAEALNVAIFELENKDKFYIDKTVIEDKIEEYKGKINEEYNLIKAKSYGVKIEDSYCEELRKEFFINAGKYEMWAELKMKLLELLGDE